MADLYTKATPPVVLEPPSLPQDPQYVPQLGAHVSQSPAAPLNRPGLPPFQNPYGPSPPIQHQFVQPPLQPFMHQPGVPQQVYAGGMPPAQVYYQVRRSLE